MKAAKPTLKSGRISLFDVPMKSKRKNSGALRNFKQFGCTRKGYGTNDVFFANLATFGTGNSYEYWDFVLHQVEEVRCRLIAGGGYYIVGHSIFDDNHRIICEKKVYRVTVFMGGFCQLKGPCDPCRVFQASCQYKYKLRHFLLPFIGDSGTV